MGKFDVNFKYVHGWDNVVYNALAHHPDLANLIVVLSSFLEKI